MGASSVPNNTSAGNSKRRSQSLRERLRFSRESGRYVHRACQLHRTPRTSRLSASPSVTREAVASRCCESSGSRVLFAGLGQVGLESTGGVELGDDGGGDDLAGLDVRG